MVPVNPRKALRDDPEAGKDPFMVKTWGSDGGKADLDGRAGEDHRGERREKKARRIAAGSTLMVGDSK